MANPKKWVNVYPQGTLEGNEEQQFFIALGRNPKYKWRSVSAIAKESGLSEKRVEEIISKYYSKGMVFQNPKNEDQWGYWERVPEMVVNKKSISQTDKQSRIAGSTSCDAIQADVVYSFDTAQDVMADAMIVHSLGRQKPLNHIQMNFKPTELGVGASVFYKGPPMEGHEVKEADGNVSLECKTSKPTTFDRMVGKRGLQYILKKCEAIRTMNDDGTQVIEYWDGSKCSYLNDVLHREDGPAVERIDGSKEWHINGKLHREDGPAIEYADETKEWYINGERHRTDGPAVTWANGHKEWWWSGVQITEEHANLLNDVNSKLSQAFKKLCEES